MCKTNTFVTDTALIEERKKIITSKNSTYTYCVLIRNKHEDLPSFFGSNAEHTNASIFPWYNADIK